MKIDKLLDNYNSNFDICYNIDFFIENIENNEKRAFYSFITDSQINQKYYAMKLTFFENKITDYKNLYNYGSIKPKFIEEINFLEDYIELLFTEAKKENGNLLSVFETDNNKKRFYKLLMEYFGDNFHNKIMEIRETIPGFSKSEIEKQRLEYEQNKLEEKQKLEKEILIQKKLDKNKVEEIREGVLTMKELEDILW